MNKQELRLLMKAKLSLIDDEMLKSKSSMLSENLATLLGDLHVIQMKKCIGAFAPIAHEPHWFLNLSEDYQKLTSYPAYEKNTKVMTFKMARMSDLNVREDFGFKILGPDERAPKADPEVILIPGLGFTESGVRLGRGKGFYDKYLHHFRGVKIGICFSLQLEEMLPSEEHDVNLDYIVTEEKIIKCNENI